MKHFPLKKTLVIVGLVNLLAARAYAGEGDTFTPYFSSTLSHDSNLLRLDDNDPRGIAAGVRGRSDTLKKNLLGLNVDWQYSRQQFVVRAAVSDNDFQRFNSLDYQGKYLKTQWNYQIGNHVSGNIGQTYNRALASFNDIRGIAGNLRDQQNRFFNLNWSLHPRWQTGLSFAWNELQYDDPIQSVIGDFENYVYGVHLTYRTPKGSSAKLSLSQEDGDYPNRSVTDISTVDDGYLQDNATMELDWRYSAKTSFKLRGGYVERRYDNLPQRDYNAFDKRFSILYSPTVKTQLELSVYNETTPRDDLQASVSENRGQSLKLSWLPTSKVTVEAFYRNEEREDIDDPGFVIGPNIQRVEDNDNFSLSLNYEPRQYLDFTAGYRRVERDSTETFGSYDAEIFSLTATIRM